MVRQPSEVCSLLTLQCTTGGSASVPLLPVNPQDFTNALSGQAETGGCGGVGLTGFETEKSWTLGYLKVLLALIKTLLRSQ